MRGISPSWLAALRFTSVEKSRIGYSHNILGGEMRNRKSEPGHVFLESTGADSVNVQLRVGGSSSEVKRNVVSHDDEEPHTRSASKLMLESGLATTP